MIAPNYSHERVSDVAENDFVTLPEDALVAEAAKIMRDKDVSSVVITRKGAQKDPVGIITERDIIHRVMAESRSPFKVTVEQVMSSPLITINPESSVMDAITLMRSNRISFSDSIKSKGSGPQRRKLCFRQGSRILLIRIGTCSGRSAFYLQNHSSQQIQLVRKTVFLIKIRPSKYKLVD